MPRLLHPNRKFERITRTIQRQITTGRLTVGQKLLARAGNGAAIRDRASLGQGGCYRSLEQRGLVIVRRGAEGGTFIAQPDPAVLQESLSLLLGNTLTSPSPCSRRRRSSRWWRASWPGTREPRTSCGSNRPSRATSGRCWLRSPSFGSAGRPVPRRARGLHRERAVHSAHGAVAERTADALAGHQRCVAFAGPLCRIQRAILDAISQHDDELAHGRMVQRSELIGQLLAATAGDKAVYTV